MKNQFTMNQWITKHVTDRRLAGVAMREYALLDVDAQELACRRLTNLNHLIYSINKDPKKWHPSGNGKYAAKLATLLLSLGITPDAYYRLASNVYSKDIDHEAVHTAMSEWYLSKAPTTIISELVQAALLFGISDVMVLSSAWCNPMGWREHNRFADRVADLYRERTRYIKHLDSLVVLIEQYANNSPRELDQRKLSCMVTSVANICCYNAKGEALITRW